MLCQPLPAARLPALLCLVAVLAFSTLDVARLSAIDRPEEPSAAPPVDPQDQDEALMRRHNELAPRVKLLWQQRKDREALQGLEQLLELYQQIYPAAKYPDGHPHIVLCYRDLCRVTDELGEYEKQWKYCQDGLAMCRRLCPRDKFPHGNPNLASMLANMGNALVRRCQYAAAREYYQDAIREYRLLEEYDHRPSNIGGLIRLNHGVAKTLDRAGRLFEVCHYTSRALELTRHLSSRDGFSWASEYLANCLLLHGRALREVSKFDESAALLSDAIDAYFCMFLAYRSDDAHLGLIDSLTELGALQFQNGNYPSASRILKRANEEVNELARESDLSASLKVKILAHLLRLAYSEGLEKDIEQYQSELDSRLRGDRATSLAQIDIGKLIDCNLDLGHSFHRSGRTALAEKYFQSARDLLRTQRNSGVPVVARPSIICVDCYLGYFYESTGEYDRAYRCFAEALSIAREIFPRSEYPKGHAILSMAIQYMGTHLWLLGETDAALALFRELCAQCEARYPKEEYPKGHALPMIAHVSLGHVLLQELAFDEAALHLGKALEIATAIYPVSEYPDGHDDLTNVRREVARLELAMSRFESARALFDAALESYQRRYSVLFPQGHMTIALTLGDLGRTLSASGDYDEAEKFHLQSLAMRRRLFPSKDYPTGHPSLANALRDLGNVYRYSGRYDEAFQQYAESTRIEHAIAESFYGDSSEALLLNLAARRFQSLNHLLDSWRRTNRPASEVYKYVWLRRGFVPRIIAQRNKAVRVTASDNRSAMLDEYIDLRRQLTRALLVSATQDDLPWTTQVDGIRAINAHKELLEHRLTKQLDAVKEEGIREHSAPQQLVEALPPDAVLIDYVKFTCQTPDRPGTTAGRTHSARMLGFVITHANPIACVDLGEADRIEDLVQRWQQAVLEDREDIAGESLRQLVWDPVSKFFPAETRTVYVAPDGVLSLVAWGALPSPADAHLLVESYAIATVPHGPFLVEQLRREASHEAKPNQVLAVGDVNYGVQANATLASSLGLKQLRWLPLQGSATEVASVSAAAGERDCVLLTGSGATPSQVLLQLPRSRWAHFATHGFFVDHGLGKTLQLVSDIPGQNRLSVNPSRSTVLGRSPFVRCGVALSGANELGALDKLGVPLAAKGILTAEEIAASDCRQLELVVLSACETGRGDVVHGDGVFSVQTAFHVAGARNVIATLWKIDDAATVELMREFYRLLWEEGMSPLPALRGAQLHMIQTTMVRSPETRGPVLSGTVPLPKEGERPGPSPTRPCRKWAGFVLSGPGF